MRIDGQPTRPIRATAARDAVDVIDQRALPHRLVIERLGDVASVRRAIAAVRCAEPRPAPRRGSADPVADRWTAAPNRHRRARPARQ
jgi:methylthioribose-1-phosphate isomerase